MLLAGIANVSHILNQFLNLDIPNLYIRKPVGNIIYLSYLACLFVCMFSAVTSGNTVSVITFILSSVPRYAGRARHGGTGGCLKTYRSIYIFTDLKIKNY